MSSNAVFIGWSANEMEACLVADRSARAHTTIALSYTRVALLRLKALRLYTRPTEVRDGRLWDVVSDAPMSTEHAISRFFVPMLCDYKGWALFTDGDVLVRSDLGELFAQADPTKAVQVVQHGEERQGGVFKKDGDVQTQYHRKNWSSVMLFNCAHPAHRELTLADLNGRPGRDLHRFYWLRDDEIGALPAGWNYLVNVTTPVPNPVHLAHFTLGIPSLPGHRDDPFADEWWDVAMRIGYKMDPRQAIA